MISPSLSSPSPAGHRPETLQIIQFPNFGAHDIRDDIEEIEDDPGRAQRAIRGAGTDAVVEAGCSLISSTMARKCGSLVPVAITK
jgi:hypothetical protein